jgi:hypothetical protein
MNWEDGFCLSKSSKPLMCSLRDYGKLPEYYDELQSLWGYMGLYTLDRPSPVPFLSPLVCFQLDSELPSPLKLVLLHSFHLLHAHVFWNHPLLFLLPSAHFTFLWPPAYNHLLKPTILHSSDTCFLKPVLANSYPVLTSHWFAWWGRVATNESRWSPLTLTF